MSNLVYCVFFVCVSSLGGLAQDSLLLVRVFEHLNPDIFLRANSMELDLLSLEVRMGKDTICLSSSLASERINLLCNELYHEVRNPRGQMDMLSLVDRTMLTMAVKQLSQLNGDSRRIRKCISYSAGDLSALRRAVLDCSGYKGGIYRRIEVEFVFQSSRFSLFSSAEYPFMFPWESNDGDILYNHKIPSLISEILAFGHFELHQEIDNDFLFTDRRSLEYQVYLRLKRTNCDK